MKRKPGTEYTDEKGVLHIILSNEECRRLREILDNPEPPTENLIRMFKGKDKFLFTGETIW